MHCARLCPPPRTNSANESTIARVSQNRSDEPKVPAGTQQESLQQLDLLQGFPALRDALIPATPEPVSVAAELRASGVVNPVARVRVDSTLPQVDRTFDYRVPAEMNEDAVPGARVRVMFNGHEMSGYIEERAATTDWTRSSLAPLKGVLSRVPVVAPEIFSVAEALADRYASTVANVLRLAVPPRVAALDKKYAPFLPGYDPSQVGPQAPVEGESAGNPSIEGEGCESQVQAEGGLAKNSLTGGNSSLPPAHPRPSPLSLPPRWRTHPMPPRSSPITKTAPNLSRTWPPASRAAPS